ncbi:ER degradation-enhancing alpha-mannosidase-like protein 2 [Argiope bruennichi]|uniref:ER degradation-enhancing alpha-mannosidase-like protein 2 n=1 Tax=Argiope bruennichi TaxID=94029 RepID=UPI002495225C|nr:ER degradation-enhancing alpha-mannosidase-like protein 2 [Argiope bruennichi]
MNCIYVFCYVYIFVFSLVSLKPYSFRTFTDKDVKMYREKVVQMFHHAYDHYLKSAFPYDELQPISCKGMDTWGSFSLTLIDALDTLAVMKNYTEFRRVVNTLLSTADFNVNINVSVFETNIRVVGGLLSAHLLSKRAGMDVDPGWPCSGPLLTLAEKVARRLLPAFQTKTGMPFGTVNLQYGVPEGETPITCTAGVSTFIVEFGTLSQLTGDPIFENVAVNALEALWKRRSQLGLVGNHINVQDGKWTALDSGIGGGVDSYFEYLVKGAILFQEPKFLKMFKEYEKLISKYMKRDDWYFWVSMNSGQVTMPTFQSLEAFWPGLLTLVGDIEQAVKTLYNYHSIWKQYGFTPEIYDVSHSHAKRENYPLRPEFIESIMYLYYATKDQHLLEIGVDILESIERSARTECGYATIKNVLDHKIEDRMESFFLAETTKYLYLLFDPDNFIHNNGSCGELIEMSGGSCIIGAGGYVFNTEAHPIDIGAVYCCSARHHDHQLRLYEFQKNMDLHSLLEIRDNKDFFRTFKGNKKHSFKSKNPKYQLENFNTDDANLLNSSTEEISYLVNSNTNVSVKNDINAIFTDSSSNDSTSDVISSANSNATSTSGVISSVNSNASTSSVFSSLNTNASTSDVISPFYTNAVISDVISHLNENELTEENANYFGNNSNGNLQPNQSFLKNVSINNFVNNATELNIEQQSVSENIATNNKVDKEILELFSIDDALNEQLKSQAFQEMVLNSTFEEAQLMIITNETSSNSTIPNSLDKEIQETITSSSTDSFDKEFYRYELLFCPAQPFTARLNIMGEMFNV